MNLEQKATFRWKIAMQKIMQFLLIFLKLKIEKHAIRVNAK